MRSNRRLEFRRHIAVRCKIIFQFNMQSRGYFGRLEFKHDSKKSEMLVGLYHSFLTLKAHPNRSQKTTLLLVDLKGRTRRP